jgi:N-acyl-D-aspartate/D-glutamate deacylase
MFDTVIRNATLYDGSGGSPFGADVALEGDRIAVVGTVRGEARREITATGLALAPGFIDVHSHDDFAALIHRDMAFKALGGVTTCIVGNCGFGAAPRAEAATFARAFHPDDELPSYDGYGGYLAHLDAHPPGVNIGVLAGHGTLRMAAMKGARRAPDDREMREMKRLLREGLESGVLGLSTGLIYEPGCHAGTGELIELASELHGTRGLYATHMRDEAARLVESVDEAIRIGEAAGVPVQISHHKAFGRPNWGLVSESLRRIERARAAGTRVHADQYPYTAGSTVLAAVVQTRMVSDRDEADVSPGDVVVASSQPHPEWEGRSLEELAGRFGCSAMEAADRVLGQAPGTTVVLHGLCEDDVQTVLRHPSTMIGSDGIPTLGGKPHPRLYNSFARVLGHYAREVGILSLPEAVRRMTGLAADTFGLDDRGYLREGSCADLVLFDADAIIDRGTFAEPNQYPDGIHQVFVNGVEVARGKRHSGALPGRALRRRD